MKICEVAPSERVLQNCFKVVVIVFSRDPGGGGGPGHTKNEVGLNGKKKKKTGFFSHPEA